MCKIRDCTPRIQRNKKTLSTNFLTVAARARRDDGDDGVYTMGEDDFARAFALFLFVGLGGRKKEMIYQYNVFGTLLPEQAHANG